MVSSSLRPSSRQSVLRIYPLIIGINRVKSGCLILPHDRKQGGYRTGLFKSYTTGAGLGSWPPGTSEPQPPALQLGGKLRQNRKTFSTELGLGWGVGAPAPTKKVDFYRAGAGLGSWSSSANKKGIFSTELGLCRPRGTSSDIVQNVRHTGGRSIFTAIFANHQTAGGPKRPGAPATGPKRGDAPPPKRS